MSSEQLEGIVEVLRELDEDVSVPKNIKGKISNVINLLNNGNTEASIKVNQALHILDEIADDTNIKSFTRTQIWNIVSLLEKV